MVGENRRNAYCFQGFHTPYGGKKTRQDMQVIYQQLLSERKVANTSVKSEKTLFLMTRLMIMSMRAI